MFKYHPSLEICFNYFQVVFIYFMERNINRSKQTHNQSINVATKYVVWRVYWTSGKMKNFCYQAFNKEENPASEMLKCLGVLERRMMCSVN